MVKDETVSLQQFFLQRNTFETRTWYGTVHVYQVVSKSAPFVFPVPIAMPDRRRTSPP
jgi:hypothetical protein